MTTVVMSFGSMAPPTPVASTSNNAHHTGSRDDLGADGSTGVAVGAPAPVREFDIQVERAGAERELFLSPTTGDSGTDPSGSPELHVRTCSSTTPRGPTANARPGTEPSAWSRSERFPVGERHDQRS
jgi:hypothetical protein